MADQGGRPPARPGHGHAALCRATSSCAHTRDLTDGYTHCGRCSQCVDRRLAALTAGLPAAEDDPALYRSEVVLGERVGSEVTLVERYTGFAGDQAAVPDAAAFAAAYPEVNRALPYLGMPAAEGQEQIFRLYSRHAADLRATTNRLVHDHYEAVGGQAYPANSLLGVIVGRVPAARPTVAATALRPAAPPERGWVVDRDQFEVRLDGRPCGFGNTTEFRLLAYLSDRRGRYVSVDVLGADVWGDKLVERNTIQKAISNVRRRLRDKGIDRIAIDADRKDCYRLRVLEAVAEPVAS